MGNRVLTKEYSVVPVAAGTENQDKVSAARFTRASLTVDVGDASALVGSVSLEGSNAITDDDGVVWQANREPYFTPPTSSWVTIGSVPIDTASGSAQYGAAFSVSHRWLRVVVEIESGTATGANIGFHCMNEAT